MIKLNGWATSCEIEATALIFSCQINVRLKCSSGYTLTTFGQQGVNLLKINVQLENDHFQLLQYRHRFSLQRKPLPNGSGTPAKLCVLPAFEHRFLNQPIR